MKVTRDVVTDLLPLYLAGEASDDTRRLVEEFLKDDPALAEQVRRSTEQPLAAASLPPLPKENEMQTLRSTKRLIRLREALFWIAIFLTTAPFAVYDTSWGTGWVLLDLPLLAAFFAILAAAAWTGHLSLKRRLSATGI
jgi:anti-sigma factor RsiW